MARSNLAEYPTPIGDKILSIFVHKVGIYAAIDFDGDFPIGGDPVHALEAGLKTFDAVVPLGVDSSYNYRVEVFSTNGNTPGLGTGAVPSRTILLRWVVIATGAEVANGTDLTGYTIRLLAIGPK
jgi:hypothetical protein